MHTFDRLIAIARPYAGKLLLVALLTSVGALAELVEPWVYRAIVNDIAGVFVSRETSLLPEILEELRGGEAEPEPVAAPAEAPPASSPEAPSPSAAPQVESPSPGISSAAENSRKAAHMRRHRRQVKIQQQILKATPRCLCSASPRDTEWRATFAAFVGARLAVPYGDWGRAHRGENLLSRPTRLPSVSS